MTMKLGIVSDTHGLLRPEVTAVLEGVDLILHAGDIGGQDILDALGELAPVYTVRGNNDWGSWGESIPLVRDLDLGGLRVCMAHMKRDLPGDLSVFDLVVTGHTHKYAETRQGRTLLLNPGSCGPRRFGQPITLALAEAGERGIAVQRVDIPWD